MISGEARLRPGDADEIGGRAGTSVVVWPGESIEIEFSTAGGEAIPNAEPIRAVWVRWSPEPDLSYWGRDYFLVEEMPEPPPSAELPKDIPFF